MPYRRIVPLVALAILTACSTHEAKTAERAVSPLAGTWTRDGDVPKPDPKVPEFTRLVFAADGTLTADYVAAGGALAGVIGKAPKIQTERDSYTTPSASTLRIAEGSSFRVYQFHIADGKLYLTQDGGSDSTSFTKTT